MSLHLCTFVTGHSFGSGDIDLGLTVVLIVCVALFTLFTWLSILLRRPIFWASFTPTLFLTLSSVLQLTFIVLVSRNVLPLDHSLEFSALGIPLCILGLVEVSRRKAGADLPWGIAICVSLGLVMWLFLTAVH